MRSTFALLALVVIATPARAGNPVNEKLLAASPSEQILALGNVVGCGAKTVLYMGKMSNKDLAYWSVRCADQREYVFAMKPDGSGEILECALYEKANTGKCFNTLNR
jgi:hypothetical protein